MDKHSPKISVKVNGSEIVYAEKRKAVVSRRDDAVILVSPIEPIQTPKTVTTKKTIGMKKRIVLTIGSAVILGTGLGFGVLQMIGNNETGVKQPAAITSSQQQPPVSQQKENNVNATLQPIQLYVIQGGSFSSKEKGQAAIEEIKKKDVPASLREADGKYYVLTAVSNDETTAKQMIDMRNKKGVNTYVKQWSIVQKDLPKSYSAQKDIIVKTEMLLVALEKQSSLFYRNGNVDQTEWNRISNERESIVKDGKGVEQAEVKKLLTYTLSAYNMLSDYKVKKDDSTFSKLQQSLLDGFTTYEQMVTMQ